VERKDYLHQLFGSALPNAAQDVGGLCCKVAKPGLDKVLGTRNNNLPQLLEHHQENGDPFFTVVPDGRARANGHLLYLCWHKGVKLI